MLLYSPQFPDVVQLPEFDVLPFQQQFVDDARQVSEVPVVITFIPEAIVGPLVSPTLYFVTQRFLPPVPLYAAGINKAVNGSQSA